MNINETENIKGIALVCDSQGYVIDLWRDDVGLDEDNPIGKLFVNLIDKGSRKKALNFIYEIRSQNVAFDYQLNLSLNGEIKTLTFVGVQLKNELLVLGAVNRNEAIEFTNYLQQINNEQANTIRELLKKQTQDTRDTTISRPEDEGMFDEITRLNNEMANLQRQLTKKNAELERVNQLKNRFMGIAAHDLRNPLNIILSYADFLQEEAGDKLDEEQNDFLNKIVESSNYMLKLIENLLDYSKIESGNMELEKEDFDVVQLMRRVVETNKQIASRKQIEIQFHSEFDKKVVHADYFKMEQVFNNLISNAIKFSFPDSNVEISINSNNSHMLISFKDFGKGIKSSSLGELFVPFNQIDKKGTKGEKGSGLGLTIVKNIVEAHNGKVWAESEPGRGSVFYIDLPLSEE